MLLIMVIEDTDNFKEWFHKHEDDVNELSKMLVELSARLYTHNSQMAEAELEEVAVAVETLKEPDLAGKKVSVAESEKIAIFSTGNKYGIMKAEMQAAEHVLNSLKVRIRVLAGEKFLGAEAV